MVVIDREELTNSGVQMREKHLRVMLFSPWYYGHHSSYLRHLIRYWQQQQLPGMLEIIVMPTFLEAHADVVALSSEVKDSVVRFVPMTAAEQVRLESTRPNFAKAFVQYQLVVQYAKRLQATHGLLMHFDSCQLPFVLGLPLPCPFSGIYFRPTLHYDRLDHKPTAQERRRQVRERLFLSRLLSRPQFRTLFCLDSGAVDFINQEFPNHKAVHIPDPVEAIAPNQPAAEALRMKLGVEPGRRALLAFGLLADGRKGTQQFLEALFLLKPELQQKVCILLVGEPFSEGQSTVEGWLIPVRRLPVQVITQFGYIPESEVPPYFQLADAVVAPYQHPVGTSGIVLLAAAAGKPILSSSYGLMGQLVKRYELGLAVDTTAPAEIAAALTLLLQEPAATVCSNAGMHSYAALNSPEQFASTIFQHVYRNQVLT